MFSYFTRAFGASPTREQSDLTKQQIETARAIVAEWGEFIETSQFHGQIRDEERLPFPKTAIHKSLLIVAGVEKDPDIISALPVAAFELAHFQPGVGKEALWPEGMDTVALSDFVRSADKLKVELSIDAVSTALASDPANKARYETFVGKVNEESVEILGKLDGIIQSRRN